MSFAERSRYKAPGACLLTGTAPAPATSNTGVDEIEREALRAEGLDPDDPAVLAALNRVRRELSLFNPHRGTQHRRSACRTPGHGRSA